MIGGCGVGEGVVVRVRMKEEVWVRVRVKGMGVRAWSGDRDGVQEGVKNRTVDGVGEAILTMLLKAYL